MRHTIIKIFDILIWVMGGLIVVCGLIFGIVALVNGQPVGLIAIIVAPIYAVITMALFFISIGIYNNTRRTAEALEKLANR